MGAIVTQITISGQKGAARESLEQGNLIENHGIEGDRFAGRDDRQICIFDEKGRAVLESGEFLGLCVERFTPNIYTEGLKIGSLKVGERIGLGWTELTITLAGKECYDECTENKENCPIKSNCAFAVVSAGGAVMVGDTVKLL